MRSGCAGRGAQWGHAVQVHGNLGHQQTSCDCRAPVSVVSGAGRGGRGGLQAVGQHPDVQEGSTGGPHAPVQLRAEAEAAVREQAQGGDGAQEAAGVVEVALDALGAVVVDIQGPGVHKTPREHPRRNQRGLRPLLEPPSSMRNDSDAVGAEHTPNEHVA